MRKLDTETIFGGVFGTIAIIAIIIEMSISGFSYESIVTGIKDIAGTLVVVMVFLIVIKNMIPKKETLTFAEKLNVAVDEWQKAHKPMISKYDVSPDHKLRFFMLTDPKLFFSALSDDEIQKRMLAGL